jgi:hypothetical protein
MTKRTFYVRPKSDAGYGRGDGTSYTDAWNGMDAVDWSVLNQQESTLWICGDPSGEPGFLTVFVEKSYLASSPHPLPRRELTESV